MNDEKHFAVILLLLSSSSNYTAGKDGASLFDAKITSTCSILKARADQLEQLGAGVQTSYRRGRRGCIVNQMHFALLDADFTWPLPSRHASIVIEIASSRGCREKSSPDTMNCFSGAIARKARDQRFCLWTIKFVSVDSHRRNLRSSGSNLRDLAIDYTDLRGERLSSFRSK